jgi:integrase
MASIIREANGRRRIEFVIPGRTRQRIRLGKANQRTAEGIKTKIESLVSATASGCGWDNDTAEWVGRIGDDLADRLAAAGLIPHRERLVCPPLKEFTEGVKDGKANLKPNTLRNYDQTIRRLVDHFGADRTLDSISCGDADQWREQLLKNGLAPATVGREVKRARQFFRAAVRRKLIDENPFADVAAPAQVNTSREFYITRETTEKVLAACPDAEWQLIVALSRYGGLRCPSETQALRWGDIDWENQRINVPSPKTEHLPGGAYRTMPLFGELRPYLETVFDQADPGSQHVIARYRGDNQNLRTQFQRILRRAGVKTWERLFHNLRASRETELTEHFPLHVVCNWIGNSAIIAARHYLQVTDSHFAKAVGTAPSEGTPGTVDKGGAKCGALHSQKVAQNAAQHAVAQQRTEGNKTKKARKSRAEVQSCAISSDTVQDYSIPRRGVEPLSPP